MRLLNGFILKPLTIVVCTVRIYCFNKELKLHYLCISYQRMNIKHLVLAEFLSKYFSLDRFIFST